MTIKAKFAGKCWGCGGQVDLGEVCALVMFGGKKKIAHTRCEAAALAKPGVTRPVERAPRAASAGIRPAGAVVQLRPGDTFTPTAKAYLLDMGDALATLQRMQDELLVLRGKLLAALNNPVALK